MRGNEKIGRDKMALCFGTPNAGAPRTSRLRLSVPPAAEPLPSDQDAAAPFAGFATGGRSGADFANGFSHPSRLTARGMGLAVLAVVLGGFLSAAAGLTTPSAGGWTGLFLYVLALWSVWMVWRTALGDTDVSGHLLLPFVGATATILFAHLVAGQAADWAASGAQSAQQPADRARWAWAYGGKDGDLLTVEGATILIRLLVLLVVTVVFQDVLTRLREPRWLLTGAGLAAAVGAVLRLSLTLTVPAAPAVALGGLAGVGMLLTPCLLPEWRPDHPPGRLVGRLIEAEKVLRLAVAGVLLALLAVSHYRAAGAVAAGAAVCGLMLLVSGAILPAVRVRALLVGTVLLAGSGAALWRMGAVGWLESYPWAGGSRLPTLQTSDLLGWSKAVGLFSRPDASGLHVLAGLAGWIGAGCVLAGAAAAMGHSLCRVRRAAPGDQARAALWSCVAGVASAALLVEGGLSVPSVLVIAAGVWAVTPWMMAHRMGRFRGWGLVLPFLAVLLVMGLTHRMVGAPWLDPAIRHQDGLMHFVGTYLLAEVILWRARAHRLWHGLMGALAAAAATALGEVAQEFVPYRSAQFSDVLWDLAGAGAALAVFAGVRGLLRLEALLAGRPRPAVEKYESWSKR